MTSPHRAQCSQGRPLAWAVGLVFLAIASAAAAPAAGPAAAPAAAAQPAPPASQPPILSASGAFFALSVPDARASARWYEEKLGLTVVMDPPKHEKTKVIVLEGGGLIVELVQDDTGVPRPGGAGNPMSMHGFAKAGVIVSDFEATLAALRQRKVEIAYGPYPGGKGQRANLILRDADGNLIQLFGR